MSLTSEPRIRRPWKKRRRLRTGCWWRSAIALRARETGAPIDYPVRLGRPSPQIARFLFGEDFEIVTRASPDGTELSLHRKGDPRVLDRSIGRLGLEWRVQDSAPPPPGAGSE